MEEARFIVAGPGAGWSEFTGWVCLGFSCILVAIGFVLWWFSRLSREAIDENEAQQRRDEGS
jgi:hypothetical protein